MEKQQEWTNDNLDDSLVHSRVPDIIHKRVKLNPQGGLVLPFGGHWLEGGSEGVSEWIQPTRREESRCSQQAPAGQAMTQEEAADVS